MASRILILEDSPLDQRILQSALGRLYEIRFVDSAEKVLAAAVEFRPDLMLLDVVLPDGTGFDAYAILRKDPRLADVPVFFVSGRTSPVDRVAGLSLGADDYVTKPFDAEELKVRVGNRLRKRELSTTENQVIEKGALRIETSTQAVYLQSPEGKLTQVSLAPMEYRLLLFLARHEGQLFSRKALLEKVWGAQNIHVTERSVDTQIKGLRQKCVGCESYFVSVYGEGYRFDTNLTGAKRAV